MKIGIPVTNGELSSHFGHCEFFFVADVDTQTGKITDSANHEPPDHTPGAFPAWLREMGVELVIAGGMGSRAQGLFSQAGIEVITGISVQAPENIINEYLENKLTPGENVCDH